jgi:hypothetical protein
MRARKARAVPIDVGPEAMGREATDALCHARDQLVAIEAARPWAVRALLAAAIGDRADVRRRGLAFLVGHFYNGPALDAQQTQLRQVLDRQAPGLTAFVEKVHRDTLAAVEDAALALGVAIGMQMRVTAEDVKAARVSMICDATGVKAAVSEAIRVRGPEGYRWQADVIGGGR